MLVSLHMHTYSHIERERHVCIAKSKVKTDTSFRENWEGHGKKSNKLVCVYHCSITMNWKYCLIIEWLEWKWEQRIQWKESSGDGTGQTRSCCSYATSPNQIESNGIERKLILKWPNKQLIPRRYVQIVHTAHDTQTSTNIILRLFRSMYINDTKRWKFNWMTQNKQNANEPTKTR